MLHFGIDDEDAFFAATQRLQDEMQEWLRAQSDLDPEAWLDARLLLDWKWGYGDGALDTLTVGQIEEFLLEWCPRKLSFPPDTWLPIIEGVRAWIRFLEDTGQWRGRSTAPLLARLHSIEPEFIDAMGNPENFGMAKGLFAGGAAATGIIPDPDDPSSIDALMAAFNELSFEERAAILDPLTDNMVDASPEPIALPLLDDPDPADLATAVAAAPILAHVDAIRAHLGKGKTLTQKLNPKVADAKALAAILDTTDLLDTVEPIEHTVRSADQLPHLMYLLEAIEEAGAIDIVGQKLMPDPTWDELDDLEKVSELFMTLYAMGPITSMGISQTRPEDELLEDGFGHWIVPLLYGETIDMDELVDSAVDVLGQSGIPLWLANSDHQRDFVARRIERSFDIAERCGLITRTGARIEPDTSGVGFDRRGGQVAATASGRLILRYAATDAGYAVSSVGELSDLSALDLLDTADFGADLDSSAVWRAWNPDGTDADKARALVDAMQRCDHPRGRLAAFELLGNAPTAAIEPLRSLIGGPLEGHAAVFLMETGHVAETELLGGDVDSLPTASMSLAVDLLADDLDHSAEDMLERWQALAQPDGVEPLSASDQRALHEHMLADLWRVDLPETLIVLEALGKLLPDPELAKAARKASFKHRTRYSG